MLDSSGGQCQVPQHLTRWPWALGRPSDVHSLHVEKRDPEERGHLFEVTRLVTGRTQVAQRSGSSRGQGLGHQGRGWGGGEWQS